MNASTPLALIDELRGAGVPVDDLWELVNGTVQYRKAVPILIDWLRASRCAGACVGTSEGPRSARSRPDRTSGASAVAPVLIEAFRRKSDPAGAGMGWVIGNALSVVADDSLFNEMASLARERRFGKARQMIFGRFARSRDQRAATLLAELLSDSDVTAQAVIPLGKLRPDGVRSAVEPLLDHPRALVRREARTTLARLP